MTLAVIVTTVVLIGFYAFDSLAKSFKREFEINEESLRRNEEKE